MLVIYDLVYVILYRLYQYFYYMVIGNVGFAERLLEGDSTELECPVSDIDTGDVIWVSPDGQKIDADSTDKR